MIKLVEQTFYTMYSSLQFWFGPSFYVFISLLSVFGGYFITLFTRDKLLKNILKFRDVANFLFYNDFPEIKLLFEI